MNKQKLIKEYFSELGKKSVKTKQIRYGAEGFHNYLKQIAKLPRKRKSLQSNKRYAIIKKNQ